MRYFAYARYKPSGIEWIGEIPEHWEVNRLRHALQSISNGTTETQVDFETEFPVTRIESISKGTINYCNIGFVQGNNQIANYFLKYGDILISHINSFEMVGNCAFYRGERPLYVGMNLLRLRSKEDVYPELLLSWLKSKIFIHAVRMVSKHAINQVSVPTSLIKDLPFISPSFSEQHAIAAFLDRETARIDALISKKERQIELLQEKRTALISHVVTKGLNPDVKMKSSGIEWLGEIPEHWKIVSLKFAILPRGDAIKTGPFGSQLLSSEMVAGSVKVYNQRNVLDRDFLSGENYITEDKYQELIAFTIFPGDILVTTRGTIGRCALFPANAQPGILHPCLMRIQANPQVVLPDYLPMLIQDGGIVLLQLKLMSNATTIDVIYSESLKSVRLPLPSTQEQQKILTWINREVTKHDKLVATVCESIEKLREYRTALISAAVTGKIDVSRSHTDV